VGDGFSPEIQLFGVGWDHGAQIRWIHKCMILGAHTLHRHFLFRFRCSYDPSKVIRHAFGHYFVLVAIQATTMESCYISLPGIFCIADHLE
jgi:hypothetical protein